MRVFHNGEENNIHGKEEHSALDLWRSDTTFYEKHFYLYNA